MQRNADAAKRSNFAVGYAFDVGVQADAQAQQLGPGVGAEIILTPPASMVRVRMSDDRPLHPVPRIDVKPTLGAVQAVFVGHE